MEAQDRKAMLDELLLKLEQLAESKGYVTEEDMLNKLSKTEFTAEDTEYLFAELEKRGVSVKQPTEKKENIDRMLTEVNVDDAVKLYLRDIGS